MVRMHSLSARPAGETCSCERACKKNIKNREKADNQFLILRHLLLFQDNKFNLSKPTETRKLQLTSPNARLLYSAAIAVFQKYFITKMLKFGHF